MKLFLLILTIQYIKTERTCGNFLPKNRTECNALTTSYSYCCFFYIPGKTELANGCRSITVSDFTKFKGSQDYGGEQYMYDCGMTYTDMAVTQCGNPKPTIPSDCNQYSTRDSSCCYYNFFGQRGCISYGAIIKGSVPYGSMVLQCGAEHFSLLILLFMFFIF
jgi:hypothetical protein